jgi:uncharacterized protein YjbI with pentapeptide repeats
MLLIQRLSLSIGGGKRRFLNMARVSLATKNVSILVYVMMLISVFSWLSQPDQALCRGQEEKEKTGKIFADEIKKPGNEYNLTGYKVKGGIEVTPPDSEWRKWRVAAIDARPTVTITRNLAIKSVVFENDIRIYSVGFGSKVRFADCKFEGVVEFYYSEFGKGLEFENCLFDDDVIFNGIQFGFPGGTNPLCLFKRCTFRQELSFLGSRFNSTSNFMDCHFYGHVIFGSYPEKEYHKFKEGDQDIENEEKKAVFTDEVRFTRSVFKGWAFFPYTEFDRGAYFDDVMFESTADFSKAKFGGYTNFSRSIFAGKTDFERAVFYAPESYEQLSRVNFYKVSFNGDVSFSKAVFLIDASFKRASFAERAFFTNTLFTREADFEMSTFRRELHASKLNYPRRILKELAVYKLNDLDEETKQKSGAEGDLFKEIGEYITGKTPRALEDKDLKETIRSWVHNKTLAEIVKEKPWKNGTLYVGKKTFEIIDHGDLSCDENEFVFTGANFSAAVDFRGAWFTEADFSSNDIVTVFQGPADFSKSSFRKKVDLRGTVFLGDIDLPLSNLFSDTGMVSTGFALSKIFCKSCFVSKRDRIVVFKEDDPDSIDYENLRELYDQFEYLFRRSFQLSEANEMALRASWLRLREGKELFASLLTLVALPIWNLVVIVVVVNGFFYFCLLGMKDKGVYGRKSEKSFKPGKLPLIYMSSPGIREKEIDKCQNLWRRFSWPLFLCLGTFFAVFSLGSEYVTRSQSCLRYIKILRLAGFILLPLLLYSLAKRSEGLHRIFTLIG